MTNTVSIGYFTGAHGVSGHLKLSTEVPLHTIIKGTWCFVEIQKKPVPFFIEDAWGDLQNWVLKLKGIDKPEQAKFYQGLRLSLDKKCVKDKQAFIGSHLIGFAVIESSSKFVIGLITDIYDNSGQMIIEVHKDGKETMIPLHEDFVEVYDENLKNIVLSLPQGLLDL